jgi:hypothetical protein
LIEKLLNFLLTFPIAGRAKQGAQSGHCRPCLCRAAPPHSLEEEFEGELRPARIARSRHAPEVLAISDVATGPQLIVCRVYN